MDNVIVEGLKYANLPLSFLLLIAGITYLVKHIKAKLETIEQSLDNIEACIKELNNLQAIVVDSNKSLWEQQKGITERLLSILERSHGRRKA